MEIVNFAIPFLPNGCDKLPEGVSPLRVSLIALLGKFTILVFQQYYDIYMRSSSMLVLFPVP